jgi:hypothetical protein
MEYHGKYSAFNPEQIQTYPVSERTNKVSLIDLLSPEHAMEKVFDLPEVQAEKIEYLAEQIVGHRNEGKPVILFTGGHLIKNGLGRITADLVERDILTMISGQGSTAIHDFELALFGETSEYVPKGLENGTFGMAYEFGYINTALQVGNRHKLGFGESLGRMICDAEFRSDVLAICGRDDAPQEFAHPEASLLRACYEKDIPFTIHAGIGTDVLDQHASFDGEAKGGTSGRDFLIYTQQITDFTEGGIALNVGSAVTGPEVLLKAVSMAANIGKAPDKLITADFDMRDYAPDKMTDESSKFYYLRDQKSVVTRVPDAYNGKGYYIKGDQRETFPYLYQKIIEQL